MDHLALRALSAPNFLHEILAHLSWDEIAHFIQIYKIDLAPLLQPSFHLSRLGQKLLPMPLLLSVERISL
jgi:hypothetical protein